MEPREITCKNVSKTVENILPFNVALSSEIQIFFAGLTGGVDSNDSDSGADYFKNGQHCFES